MKIITFWRPFHSYGVFSNFSHTKFEYKGQIFENSEAAFMYEKALYFGDDYNARKILHSSTPQEARKYGRAVTGYDDVLWSNVRYDTMKNVLRSKFKYNSYAASVLKGTKNALLVEASPYDIIWGVGLDYKSVLDGKKWRGSNLLGKALMEIRDEL